MVITLDNSFNRYACGNYKNSYNPETQSRISIINEETIKKVQYYLEDETIDSDAPETVKQTKIFYRGCINEGTIDEINH